MAVSLESMTLQAAQKERRCVQHFLVESAEKLKSPLNGPLMQKTAAAVTGSGREREGWWAGCPAHERERGKERRTIRAR